MIGRAGRVALAAAAALILAGCGGSEDSAEQLAPAADQSKTGAATTSIAAEKSDTADSPGHEAEHDIARPESAAVLPAIDVVRMSTGDKVSLSSLHVAGKPTLLWFWAPHCSICRAEAPDLLKFEKEHGTEVAVLGIGAQDSLEQAKGFIGDTSTDGLDMIWDASGKTWLHWKVTNQPTVIVLDKDGKVVKTWFRDLDEKAILAAARKD